MTADKKIAIVSDQICGGIGGAESIVFNAIDTFPQADIYATIINRDILPEKYKKLHFNTTFIQNLPLSKKIYKAYFPLMPLAVEYLNMQKYDIIFSSHHSVAKGIITKPEATHICYCHSPARYIWDLFWTYSDLNGFNAFSRIGVAAVSQFIRTWDVITANRVDHFLANSNYTALRIKKFYNRDSEVLFPPVNTDRFNYESAGDYYFMLGRLVAYKGFELAVDAFNESGKKLIIAGSGAEFDKLKAKAKPNVQLVGRIPDEEVKKHMNNCKGFVFPGKEDFGIVMVEAQSAGKPVIAFNGGGAQDIVKNNQTGILFNTQTTEDLNKAIEQCDSTTWDHTYIAEHAKQFDVSLFNARLEYILKNAEQFKMQNNLKGDMQHSTHKLSELAGQVNVEQTANID